MSRGKPFDEVLTARETAARLKVSYRVALGMIEYGGLPAIKVGKEWRVRVKDLDAWWQMQQEKRLKEGWP